MDIREIKYFSEKEGEIKGEKKGIRKQTANLIRNMMESGYSFEQTCVLFKLTEEEIKEVREYMNRK